MTPAPFPRFSAFLAMSLDGFIAREDGGLDFLSAVERPGEDYGYAAFSATVDTVLLGRGTYDVVQGFPSWPYEGKRVLVATHRPADPKHGEQLLYGPPQALAAQAAALGARAVYVDGGQLVRSFVEAGLLDELTVSIVPRVLGRGRPLFAAGLRERGLVLRSASSFESGLVQLRYRVER